MNDLISALLKQIRGYIPVLAAVVATPRRTIPERLYQRSDPLGDAFTFFGVTLALSLLLQAPLVGSEHDFIKVAATLLALKIVMMLVFNGAIAILFKLVGGRGGFIATLGASLYIVAPGYLFAVTMKLFGLGIITGTDPMLASDLKNGEVALVQAMQTLSGAAPDVAMWINLLILVQLVVITGWYLVCWGVYRQIHEVSRFRSSLVYIAAWLFYAGVVNLDSVILRGLYGGTTIS